LSMLVKSYSAIKILFNALRNQRESDERLNGNNCPACKNI